MVLCQPDDASVWTGVCIFPEKQTRKTVQVSTWVATEWTEMEVRTPGARVGRQAPWAPAGPWGAGSGAPGSWGDPPGRLGKLTVGTAGTARTKPASLSLAVLRVNAWLPT